MQVEGRHLATAIDNHIVIFYVTITLSIRGVIVVNNKVTEKEVESVVAGIRACFARLRAVGDAMHQDFGVTTAMRAVLETVSAEEELTVPDIARVKRVSRQNIQVIVDGLVAGGLVQLTENPAHKRSPLVELSKRGREVFREMRRRERSAFGLIASDLTPANVAATQETLAAIKLRLEEMEADTISKGKRND